MSTSAQDSTTQTEFDLALESIRKASFRSELAVSEIPAPANLAPEAFALTADVKPGGHGSDSEFATGRFILLHDRTEPEPWGGPFRIVCYAQAPLETEIGVDPFLAEVAWSWMVDALDARQAAYSLASGTVTRILSTGFGALSDQGDGSQLELRASWSPLLGDAGLHVQAWGDLLCMLAGLPPSSEGVSLLAARRSRS
ncbi:MAG: DUF3000 domain-containing protein [Cryobacterium sp.]|nr:DUF3000 domain-containing protein [Cryobacterium sp.]MBX3117135.1 DUF3000 domain-containing protein [Cryobacterium sp.]